MLELAAVGAKVLHLRCVEYARRYDIPIHVRSSFSQQGGHARGHATSQDPKETPWKQPIIAGVAHDRSEAKITVVGVPDKPGEAAADLRGAVADAEINIDMIVQNVSAAATGLTDISFTLPKADGQPARRRRSQRIQDEVGFDAICCTTTRSARSRWSAPACARTPASRRRSSTRSPTPASTSR